MIGSPKVAKASRATVTGIFAANVANVNDTLSAKKSRLYSTGVTDHEIVGSNRESLQKGKGQYS
jgi:hypothetical protein